MENNKYYTPDISEFHVGFEYWQKISSNHDEWEPLIIKSPNQTESLDGIYVDDFSLETLRIEDARVKYLDRDDIESLGWGNYEPPFEYDHTWTYKNYELKLWINGDLPHVRICENRIMIFDGKVKNKSRLKLVMEMIGIKNIET